MPRFARIDRLESRTLLAATDIDRSFSADGVITSSLNGGYNNARDVAVQADGKVIVVGEARLTKTSPTYGFAAVRYNTDGTLDDGGPNDSTPGDKFGVGGVFLYGQGTTSIPSSIAIGRDGKIVIAGYAVSSGSIVQQYWLLVRLNTDGTLDKTFNGSGVSGQEFSIDNTPLNDIALQSNGKIIAIGSHNGDFLVGRFNVDGSLDDSFGDFGTVTTDFGGTDVATGVTIDNVGNVVVVGGVGGNGVSQKAGVVRYQSDGTPDPNFAVDGKAAFGSLDRTDVAGVVVLADGRIKIAESIFESSLSVWYATVRTVTADGSASGTRGYQNHKYSAITLMPDGDIALSGIDLGTAAAPINRLFIETNGLSITPSLSFTISFGNTITVAPDGGIFEAGVTDVSGGRNFVLVKYVGVDPQTFGYASGNVFRDLDGDGVKDVNEPGTPNVRIYLDENKDGQYEPFVDGFDNEPSVLTDSNGNYTLRNLSTKSASVLREIVPAGTKQTIPAAHAFSLTALAGRTTTGQNFINTPTTVISTLTAITGSVFNDYNNDAARQTIGTIEPDMTNVVVYLDGNRNGKLDTGETYAKTDVSGNYTLALPYAGTWRVVVAPPRGFTNTSPTYRDLLVHTHTQGLARFALTPVDANDTLTEATAITLGRTIVGAIANNTDVNVYSFTVKAGQTILFDLDLGKSSSLNSYLRLFDSHGTQLIANDNAAAPGETVSLDSYIKHFFNKSGTFYVAVSNQLNTKYNPLTGKDDLGGGSIGAYSLLARAL